MASGQDKIFGMPALPVERPDEVRLLNQGAPAMSTRAPVRGEAFASAEHALKIHDRRAGLFALVEGTDDAAAQRSLALGKALVLAAGPDLSRAIENILSSNAGERAPALAERLLTDAFLNLTRVARPSLGRSEGGMNVLALKQVELTPGKPIAAFVNAGGSRLCRARGGTVETLAEPEPADSAHEPRVRLEPLRPGDRLIALSPSAAALSNDEIASLMERTPTDVRAELALQLMVIDHARTARPSNEKASDVAVIVMDVPGRVSAAPSVETGLSRAARLAQMNQLQRELIDLAKSISIREEMAPQMTGSMRERQDTLVATLRREWTEKEHRLAGHELANLREDVPPRYGAGDRVSTDDGRLRVIAGYDSGKDQYVLEDPRLGPQAPHHRHPVARFELETWQSKEMLPLRAGDRFPYAPSPGNPPQDWRVTDGSVDPQGRVFISDPQGVRHMLVSAKDVRNLLSQRIVFGRDALKRLHATARQIGREMNNRT